MTSEAALWSTVRRHLSPYGRLVRIESPLTEVGIPDVCYTLLGHTGWLELKEIPAWPVRETTPLRVPHLRIEQVVFAESWERAGGRSSFLVQVGREYYLWGPGLARGVLERRVCRAGAVLGALAAGTGYLPTTAILRALTGRGAPGAPLDPT